MELAFLGTNSALPKKDRNVSSLLIRPEQKGELILIDCGEGTQHQLVRFENYSSSKIRLIMITHLHGDHMFGLPGLLCTISGQLGKENEEVTIVGSYMTFKINIIELVPKDVKEEEIKMKEGLEYPINSHMLCKVNDRLFYECGIFFDLTIRAVEINHERIFCVGYVLEEGEKKGKLSTEKLYEEYGIHFGKVSKEFMKTHNLGKFNFRDFSVKHPTIPKNFIKLLKEGKNVEYKSKENEEMVIEYEKVLEKGKPGRKVIVLGDCCDGDPNGVLAKEFGFVEVEEEEENEGEKEGLFGIDLLVHECTFENGLEEDAVKKGHATPKIVTRLCKKLKPRACYINHFSPRYENSIEKEPNVFKLRDECREQYSRVFLAEDFKVVNI